MAAKFKSRTGLCSCSSSGGTLLPADQGAEHMHSDPEGPLRPCIMLYRSA